LLLVVVAEPETLAVQVVQGVQVAAAVAAQAVVDQLAVRDPVAAEGEADQTLETQRQGEAVPAEQTQPGRVLVIQDREPVLVTVVTPTISQAKAHRATLGWW